MRNPNQGSGHVRTIAAALLLSGIMLAGPAHAVAAECELSCAAECKQEVAACTSAAKVDAKSRKFYCKADFDFGQIQCEFEALEAQEDCIGLCGQDAAECKAQAKDILTECKAFVKEDGDECKSEAASENAAARQECKEFAADCLAGCSE